MSEATPRRYILTLTCPDRTGIVAAVASFIASHGGLITQAAQHGDALHNRFYMRVEIQADTLPFYLDELRERFTPVAKQFDMEWSVSDSSVKKRMLVLVSKLDHCLNDLLHRWRNKDLHCEIPCVISNHNDLRSFVEWHGIPFFHVPVTPDTKEQAYAEVERLFRPMHRSSSRRRHRRLQRGLPPGQAGQAPTCCCWNRASSPAAPPGMRPAWSARCGRTAT
jgi:formyltetrahydrofolate deformylase